MPSEGGEVRKQATKVVTNGGGVHSSHPAEPENSPCPRCDSTNTKFCYYNNYNLSQPRYFCKACRRYWTRGGTLRNVPVGGGSRKNSKRSRSSNSSVTPTATPPQSNMVPFGGTTPYEGRQEVGVKTEMPSCDVDLNLNEGSFTSLLTCNTTGVTQASGGDYASFPHGYGVGLGLGFGPSSGFEEMGFGLAFGPAVTDGNQHPHGGGNSWQLGNGNGGDEMDGADCFVWPDLAISTPGTGLE